MLSVRSMIVMGLLAVGGMGPAEAALLVYEGFNGYGLVGGAIGTPSPNANTVGINKITAYRATNWKYAAGMTFGALRTSGEAVAYDSGNQSYLSTQLDLDGNSATTGSFSGTLYSSYLVNLGTRVANGGVQLRVTDAFSDTAGNRFFSDADTRLSVATATNAAVGYSTAAASTGIDLALGTNYLVISRYTNVGVALSSTVTGVATMFVLTEAQFANMITQPNWELYLDNPLLGVGTGANQITAKAVTSPLTSGTYTFDDSDYVHMLAVANGVFDEFRYGDSLTSVLPIPEPGRGLLMMIGLGLLAVRRRR